MSGSSPRRGAMPGPSTVRGLALALGIGLASVVSSSIVVAAPRDASSPVADRHVHRRSGLEPWRVERVAATSDEIVATVVDRGLAREVRLSWDRVAGVDPAADGRLEVGVDSGLQIGDRIWRGIQRLQRGDARMARDAFDQALALGPRLPGDLGATVLEGLVLAGVAMGDTDRVMAEAVLVGDLAAAGVRSDRFAGPGFSGDAVDPATSLVTDVPPVASSIDPVDLRRRLREAPRFGEHSDARRDLWLRLVERSGPPELADRGLDAGTRLLLELTRLDAADPSVRNAARRRLLDAIDEAPAWRAAWIRWFTGSAAIAQAGDDADASLVGVLDLVHVLALEAAAPKAIRLASLELAAETLGRIGRPDEAAILESILIYERPDARGSEIAP